MRALADTDHDSTPPGWMHIILVVSIPVIAWSAFIRKMTTDWSTNSQYEFGYFVPFFILYLLARRWGSRPPASRDLSTRLAAILGIGILLLLLPIRIIQEASPDWRPLNWLHGTLLVILSLVPFAIIGGWAWVRHFSLPFLLIFAALPWPLSTEQAVLQGLSRVVTTFTVELLNMINIPALQRGNVIDMAAGSVGVADACSGIRSLAGTLMASIFFGEFFRLGATNRLILVLGGCLISFGLNLFRAFFLSWRAAVEGLQSIEKWHDPAGLTIFAISFAGLWFLANWMTKGEPQPNLPDPEKFQLPSFGYKWIVPGVLWTIAIGVISEMWYRNREGKRPVPIAWSLEWPPESASFKFTPVPPETRAILRYSSGKSASFRWNDGSAWQVFFFHWAPGKSSVQLATMHRPEVCLPAVGFRYVSEASALEMSLPGVTLPFSGGIFDCESGRVYVYRCLWEDFPIIGLTRDRNFDMSVTGRLLSAWHGRRNLGQRLLQVVIQGAPSEESAREQLRTKLADLVELKG